MYNLGELYHEGLSTPSEDEERLSKILREENAAVELSALAEQKLYFRVDQVIETDPWDRQNFVRLSAGGGTSLGWKHSAGIRGTSRNLTSMAMDDYENWCFPCLHALISQLDSFSLFKSIKKMLCIT
jgi:hypothetical protein